MDKCVICGEEAFGTDASDRAICEECATISKERFEKMKLFFYGEMMKGWQVFTQPFNGTTTTTPSTTWSPTTPITTTGQFTPWVYKTNTGTYSSISNGSSGTYSAVHFGQEEITG